MSDQLVGWLQVIIGLAGLILTAVSMRMTANRRHQRTVRISHWNVWGVKHTRIDLTDTHQL